MKVPFKSTDLPKLEHLKQLRAQNKSKKAT